MSFLSNSAERNSINKNIHKFTPSSAKYNQLIRIEEELGPVSRFSGRNFMRDATALSKAKSKAA